MANLNKVVLVFGGASTEHDVSLQSSAYILQCLEQGGFHVELIGISSTGCWYKVPREQALLEDGAEPQLVIDERSLVPFIAKQVSQPGDLLRQMLTGEAVVFGMIHGQFGEDGKLAAFCEEAGLPYVGCSFAAHAEPDATHESTYRRHDRRHVAGAYSPTPV